MRGLFALGHTALLSAVLALPALSTPPALAAPVPAPAAPTAAGDGQAITETRNVSEVEVEVEPEAARNRPGGGVRGYRKVSGKREYAGSARSDRSERAEGAGRSGGLGRGNRVHLTLAYGEAAMPPERTTSLACAPPRGDHPNAVAVCRDLTAAEGNFTALPGQPAGQMCTMIYSPVTVTATGRWNDRPVWFRHTYGSDCELRQQTGQVFDF
jgi:hypothetical protein